MGLIPPYLPDSSQWKWTSTDLIIKPKALINANVNLPHNPGEWALTSDSAGQNCSDLRWCFCSAAQLRLFITHGDCEDYRKSDSFSFLSLIYVLQKKRKCKSDCNVGHMLVVGTVSIVMILIYQSRCTVRHIGLSVSSLQTSKWLFVSESLWEPDSETVRHPQHYFLISLGPGCFSIWCRNEFFLNIRAVWLRPRCPGNGLISWQTSGNVFRISGQISRLYSPSVTFEFPAATGNHIRTGQYQYYSCLHHNIIDQQYQTDIITEFAWIISYKL